MSATTSPAPRAKRRFKPDRDVAEWTGPYRRYDLLKEVFVCFCVVLLLTLACAWLFSSSDELPVTLRSWSNAAPTDFVQTAITELDGTSATATYGPPYNSTAGASQKLGPISLQQAPGVTIPIDTAQDFVLGPLESLPNRPTLTRALAIYQGAPAAQQAKWDAAYESVAAKAVFRHGRVVVPKARFGPVAFLMTSLTSMARTGALDGALIASPQLYGTDYTKPLLFIADGTYMSTLADARHMSGEQWGMMNETGNYPGQAWLWLYTMWYQIPPYSTSDNADVLVWATMMVLTILLALLPFIPGLRSIPRWVPIYRIIWRDHYKRLGSGPTGGPPQTT